MAEVTPQHILQTGMGFMASKTLLSAVELGLFTRLGDRALTGAQLCGELGLSPRANPDFFDALLALGFLARDGEGAGARYRASSEAAAFLDKAKPGYIGGILEMADARLYRFWGDLSEALKTGAPQNEIKHTGRPMFEELYADEARLAQFIEAMAAISAGNVAALAQKYDFSRYKSLCDVGGASGLLSIRVAQRHPHMTCVSIDLPKVTPIAQRAIAAAGLAERVSAASLDIFSAPLPKVDVITMGHILHDWNLEKKKQLIKAAYQALNPGGAFIIIENVIDDARRENAFGLLMSLNMLIEFGDAFDFTAADFFSWCAEVGFAPGEVIPLAGPASAAVAYKPG
ncbi:MAG: methyltransferase [Pseudomonadota bacterium]